MVQRLVEQLVVELDWAGPEQLYQHRAIRPPQQQVLHGCTPRWCRPDEEEERSTRCRCSSRLTLLELDATKKRTCSEGSGVGSEGEGVLGEAVGDELLRRQATTLSADLDEADGMTMGKAVMGR